jgi:hypothetical protein
MILLDLLDRRTMWRDYWLEWLLAAVLLITLAEWLALAGRCGDGRALPARHHLPPLAIAILSFPLAAWAASRLDRWRLGIDEPASPAARPTSSSRAGCCCSAARRSAVAGALIGRMGWLSIKENERYNLLSEDNRVQLIIVPPRRGWIVDRRASRSPSTAATSGSTSSPSG